MSKGKNQKARMDARAQERQRQQSMDDAGPVLYTTSRGVEVECLPIAAEIEAQEQNIRNAIDWPDIPKRKVTDVAGSTAEFPYTEVSIETAPDEDKLKWADYLLAQERAQVDYDRRIAEARPRLIAYRGVRVVDEALPTQWAQDHIWMGMEVPDDPRERSLHFFMTEVLGNIAGDLNSILLGIYRASGYDADLLDRAEAFFRSQMGRRERPDDSGDSGDTGAQDEAGAPGVVDGTGVE